MKPEGSVDDDSDQTGLPEDAEDEDDPKCPTPADIWRSRTEDLGGDIHTR